MKFVVLSLALLVTACAGGLPAADGIPCAALAPIRPTAADVDAISGELVDQVLRFNDLGAAVCGWRAR